MKWKKIGLLFCPNRHAEWMMSHAANPIAEHLEGSLYRIYFSCRDAYNRSSIGYVVVNIMRPSPMVSLSEKVVLSPGETGAFDDSGVSGGCLVNFQDQKRLYYMGWNLGVTVPWRNSIGLAVSDPGEACFSKYSRAPVMDRGHDDPYSLSYPHVIHDEGLLKMWYGSNLSWGRDKRDMRHVIKYAESEDGIHWRRSGHIAVDLKSTGEYAISRPCVIRNRELYRMWYSYRGDSYRIGYAESADGLNWTRKDALAGIDVSPGEWDSDMICYPFVFGHEGRLFMLYNGNGYGKTGFGLAMLDEP